MTNDGNALPWFPLTPDYIDKYNESVIKYLKDEASSADQDKSYSTTVSLLHQRSVQLLSEFSSMPLEKAEGVGEKLLLQYIQTIGSEIVVLENEKADLKPMVVFLAYLISLYDKDLTDEMSSLIVRTINSNCVSEIKFDFNDIVTPDVHSLSEKLNGTVMEAGKDPVWLENKGTIQFDGEGVSMYDMNRGFIKVKKNTGGSFRKEEVIAHLPVSFQLDKKDKRDFSFQRFLTECSSIKPSEEDLVRKKIYSEDDELTVKVTSKGYEEINAISTDHSFETIAGKITLGGTPNVRGIALSDLSWNLNVGDHINVRLDENGDFDIKETILNYIYDRFWKNDEEEHIYGRMNAKLLFPKRGVIPNTWMTEYGFTVRSGFEDIPEGSYCVLEDGEYNGDIDWLADFSVNEDERVDETFTEREVKSKFIRELVYDGKAIKTPELPKIVIRHAEPWQVSMLHRTLAMKNGFLSSTDAPDYFLGCCALAAINEDQSDLDYYSVLMDYHNDILAFAANKIQSISSLNTKDIETASVSIKKQMVDTIMEYGKEEESDYLNGIISEEQDNELSTVAKLVQAANRFRGNAFLESLRGSLHREICTILEVSDAIEVPQNDVDDSFPFDPEGPNVEHKMSWVFDNETSQFNETTQSQKIMKSICAFLNNSFEDGGGHIYIGTDEKRRFVCGVKADIDALVSKGVLSGEGDVYDEYYRHISGIIKTRFPENYEKVKAQYICDGKVLDIFVSPADGGVVYFNGIAYEKYNSSARPMREDKKDAITTQKYLQKIDMAEKINNILKAKHQGKCVVLKGYDSSNSNTERNRTLEVFAFTDDTRRDGVWAYDPKDRMNKVFLLKRAEAVEISDENWKHASLHKVSDLDIFGYFGMEKIPFKMSLNSIRAKNLFVEQYPAAKNCLQQIGEKAWKIDAVLYNKISLYAASSFYLGYPDDLDISETPALVQLVTERLNALLEKI